MQYDDKITALYVRLKENNTLTLNVRVNCLLDFAVEHELDNPMFFIDTGNDPVYLPEALRMMGGMLRGEIKTVVMLYEYSCGDAPPSWTEETELGIRFIKLAYDLRDEAVSDEMYEFCKPPHGEEGG